MGEETENLGGLKVILLISESPNLNLDLFGSKTHILSNIEEFSSKTVTLLIPTSTTNSSADSSKPKSFTTGLL